MAGIPAIMLKVRTQIAQKYLRGSGIEIGALHCPLGVPPGVHVQYVDRLTEAGLRGQYAELAAERLYVDIVDDGEKLLTFADESLDFIVGNHFLEHCENPLGAIRSHLRRLRPGGILYYAVPDKCCGFDRGRQVTSWQHLVDDDRLGPERTRHDHYVEFVRNVYKKMTDQEAYDLAMRSMAIAYSIHFHVWDEPAFYGFLADAQTYLNDSFVRLDVRRNTNEFVAVLQSSGRPI